MKNNIMKKWVKALRSGKFKQGTGTLKQFNSKGEAQHCCLGVLCELYNEHMRKNKKKTLSEKVYDNDMDFSFGYSRFGGKQYHLPNEVMSWTGISTSLGHFYEGGRSELPHCLGDMNDIGYKFKTIADTIEKNWESL